MLELDFLEEEVPKQSLEGFVLGLKDTDYRKAEGMNASSLKTIARDPFLYFQKIQYPKSYAMVEGTLMHTLFLEPDMFNERFCVVNTKTRGKDTDELGRDIVTSAVYENMLECVEYIKASLKNDLGLDLDLMDSEVSYFGEWRGMKAKCRADKITKDRRACFDLKKTKDASTKEFIRQACNLDYCIQEVFYRELMGLEVFNWIAVCATPLKDRDGRNHYRYNIFEASPEFQDKGRYLIDLALKILEKKERFSKPIYASEFIIDDLEDATLQVVKSLKPPLWYMM